MITEKIYNNSPIFLQNILVSLLGLSLYSKRYGGEFRDILYSLGKQRSLSTKEIKTGQLRQLKKMLLYCDENIPYYRSLFKSSRVNVKKIDRLVQLEDIPILEKETLRQNISSFYPEDIRKKSYMIQRTSGSTGTPLEIKVDRYTYKLAMALLVEHEETHGVKFGERRATFAGRMLMPASRFRPPFWRFNRPENQLLFSSYHMSEKTVHFYLDRLNSFKPSELIGYPSAIYSLARLCRERGLDTGFTPKAIITNSETLFEWQRETIEEVFKSKVFDYYGSAEYVVFAGQCPEKKYHINPLLGILEVVNDSGSRVVEEAGLAVSTTLTNYATPLIRYKTGDLAILSGSLCSCGSGYEVLNSIEGRKDDIIEAADGRKIGRLDHVFKGVRSIVECQIIQLAADDFKLKLVKESRFSESDRELLISNMKQRIGPDINVTIDYVNHIKRTSRGKFKGVVNQMVSR